MNLVNREIRQSKAELNTVRGQREKRNSEHDVNVAIDKIVDDIDNRVLKFGKSNAIRLEDTVTDRKSRVFREQGRIRTFLSSDSQLASGYCRGCGIQNAWGSSA